MRIDGSFSKILDERCGAGLVHAVWCASSWHFASVLQPLASDHAMTHDPSRSPRQNKSGIYVNNTYTDVDETLFPHGSTMPAGAGQPPVIGEIVKLREEPLFDPSGPSARRDAAR